MSTKRSNQILVKYGCGCIGFPPFHDGTAFLLKSCQSHTGDVEPGYTPSTNKIKEQYLDSYKRLSWAEQDEILTRLSVLCQDGHDLDRVKRAITDAASPPRKSPKRTIENEPERGD